MHADTIQSRKTLNTRPLAQNSEHNIHLLLSLETVSRHSQVDGTSPLSNQLEHFGECHGVVQQCQRVVHVHHRVKRKAGILQDSPHMFVY